MLRFAWLPAAFGVLLLTALVGAQGRRVRPSGSRHGRTAGCPSRCRDRRHPSGERHVSRDGLRTGRRVLRAGLPSRPIPGRGRSHRVQEIQQEDVDPHPRQHADGRAPARGRRLQETVTVSGEVPQVDLTSARVGGNVASREILELPSPTRNFISFVAMLPGVQLNPSAEGSDSLSINGQSNTQVNFVLDGGNNTDDNSASPSGAQARTPLEAVQEFQVVRPTSSTSSSAARRAAW